MTFDHQRENPKLELAEMNAVRLIAHLNFDLQVTFRVLSSFAVQILYHKSR